MSAVLAATSSRRAGDQSAQLLGLALRAGRRQAVFAQSDAGYEQSIDLIGFLAGALPPPVSCGHLGRDLDHLGSVVDQSNG